MTRINVSFYTNILTPNQKDLFSELSNLCCLTAVCYASTENDRSWKNLDNGLAFNIVKLKNVLWAKYVQVKFKDFHFSIDLISHVLKDDSDYVLLSGAYWIPNTLVALTILKIRGKKVTFFGERLKPHKTIWKKYARKLLLSPIRVLCTRIFVIGKQAELDYKLEGFKQPVSNIPYCISKRDTTNKIFQRKDDLVFLSSGSLIDRKGMDILIKAFGELSINEYPNIKLNILGEGSDREYLTTLINNDPRIALKGFKQPHEAYEDLRKSDVFIFASRYDGWGVVINEAIEAGLPIIASSEVGAVKEWLIHDYNALICDPNEIDQWVSAIKRVIKEESLGHLLCERIKELRDSASADIYAKRILHIIKEDLSV